MANVSKLIKYQIRRFRKKEDGQALTEFAMVAPILILLAVGILLLGYFIFCHIVVVNAANQGARAGSALVADEDVSESEAISRAETTAESTLSSGLNIDEGSVDIQLTDKFSVDVEYNFDFPISFPGMPASHTISHTSSYMIWGDD